MKSINRDLLDLLRQGGNSFKHNNTDITLDTTPLNTQPDNMSSENLIQRDSLGDASRLTTDLCGSKELMGENSV